MEAINVVFLSVLRGTRPIARCPLGARAEIGVKLICSAAFVHHHDVVRNALGYPVSVRVPGCFVPFGGAQRLFLRVQPRRRIARPTVHWLRAVPWVVFHSRVCASIVASGLASNCAHSARC